MRRQARSPSDIPQSHPDSPDVSNFHSRQTSETDSSLVRAESDSGLISNTSRQNRELSLTNVASSHQAELSPAPSYQSGMYKKGQDSSIPPKFEDISMNSAANFDESLSRNSFIEDSGLLTPLKQRRGWIFFMK